MSLTEREKEIALECAKNADMCTEEGSLVVYREDVFGMFDDFLSRIREEQEAFGYVLNEDIEYLVNEPDDRTIPLYQEAGDRPLFTTPPAAPCNCSELVEALKELLSRVECDADSKRWWPDARHKARVALASRAKRMKLTQAILGEE